MKLLTALTIAFLFTCACAQTQCSTSEGVSMTTDDEGYVLFTLTPQATQGLGFHIGFKVSLSFTPNTGDQIAFNVNNTPDTTLGGVNIDNNLGRDTSLKVWIYRSATDEVDIYYSNENTFIDIDVDPADPTSTDITQGPSLTLGQTDPVYIRLGAVNIDDRVEVSNAEFFDSSSLTNRYASVDEDFRASESTDETTINAEWVGTVVSCSAIQEPQSVIAIGFLVLVGVAGLVCCAVIVGIIFFVSSSSGSAPVRYGGPQGGYGGSPYGGSPDPYGGAPSPYGGSAYGGAPPAYGGAPAPGYAKGNY